MVVGLSIADACGGWFSLCILEMLAYLSIYHHPSILYIFGILYT